MSRGLPSRTPSGHPGRRAPRLQRHHLAASAHPGRRVVPAGRGAATFRPLVHRRRRRPADASSSRGPRPRPRRRRPPGRTARLAPPLVAGTARTSLPATTFGLPPTGGWPFSSSPPGAGRPTNGTLRLRTASDPAPPAPVRATPIRAPRRGLPASAADPSTMEPDGSRFDILVVYTPAARDGDGGTPRCRGPHRPVQLANEHNADLAGVYQLRNLQAADLVHILVEEHQPSRAYPDCGLADGSRWVPPFEPPYRFHPFEVSFALTVRTPWCASPKVFATRWATTSEGTTPRTSPARRVPRGTRHPFAFGYINQERPSRGRPCRAGG